MVTLDRIEAALWYAELKGTNIVLKPYELRELLEAYKKLESIVAALDQKEESVDSEEPQ